MKPASSRRASREFALQGVYQWIYTGATPATVLRNLSELDDFDKADAEHRVGRGPREVPRDEVELGGEALRIR